MRFAEYMEAQDAIRRLRRRESRSRRAHRPVRPSVPLVEPEPEPEPEDVSMFDLREVPQEFKDKVMAELAEAERRIREMQAAR